MPPDVTTTGIVDLADFAARAETLPLPATSTSALDEFASQCRQRSIVARPAVLDLDVLIFTKPASFLSP